MFLVSSVLIFPIFDVTSDYIAASKHIRFVDSNQLLPVSLNIFARRNNDTAWGAVTASVTFMPSILGFICLSGDISDKLYLFAMLLPVLQLALFAKQGWQIFKESITGYEKAKQIAVADKLDRKRLKREEQNARAQREADKSTFQYFKIFECIGEAGPQSILQTSIIMKRCKTLASIWTYIMKDFHVSPFKSTLFTILSSLLSLVITGGSMIVELEFNINGESVVPYHSILQSLIHAILMIPLVIPRVIAISIIIASFNSWYSTIPILISGAVYIFLSYILYKVFQQTRNSKEFSKGVSELVRMMIITSVIMPCYIINPLWNLLALQSLLSALILSSTLFSLIILSHVESVYLRLSIIEDPFLFRTVIVIVIGCLLLGSLATLFQVWLVRKHHQTFLYQCLYGNVKKVEAMLRSGDNLKHDFNEMNGSGRNVKDYVRDMKSEDILKLFDQYAENFY